LFTKNCLVTYKLSHDVLSNNKYAERTAAKFIRNDEIGLMKLDCSSIGWR
jgi:hypothetical protein